jgi:hypothetical protein
MLLLGGLGAALPLLLHLLRREKPKPVSLPTFEFLLRAAATSSRSRRMDQILLLLIRMATIICLALLLARPKLDTRGSGQAAALAVVIDNSFYAAQAVDGKPQIEWARQKALDLLGSLPSGSLVAVVDAQEDCSFTPMIQGAQDRVKSLTTETRALDLGSLARRAATALATLDTKLPKRLVILSDLNPGAWPAGAASLQPPPGLSLEWHKLPERRGNAAVAGLKLRRNPDMLADIPCEIVARIAGDLPPGGLRVMLREDGQEIDSATVSREAPDAVFVVTPSRQAARRLEVVLEPGDLLGADDAWPLALVAAEPVELTIYTDAAGTELDNSALLNAALSPAGAISRGWRLSRRSYDSLEQPLKTAGGVVLCGSLDLGSAALERLAAFAHNGGQLLIWPDASARLERLAPLIGETPTAAGEAIELRPDESWERGRSLRQQFKREFEEGRFSGCLLFKGGGRPLLGAPEGAVVGRCSRDTWFLGLDASSPRGEALLGCDFLGPLLVAIFAEAAPPARREAWHRCGEGVLLPAAPPCKIRGPDGSTEEPRELPEGRLATSTSMPGFYNSDWSAMPVFACVLERSPAHYAAPLPDKLPGGEQVPLGRLDSLGLPPELPAMIFGVLLLLLGLAEIFVADRSLRHARV